ncbi:uncharacterized protein MELLADRAFT_72856 [Melampsora larici-populina 98AG31]|uniref:Secreted protein n=1 Tax=Melampsora larici-populina (strain 98AG31 / pathotype 3-4-7) TaxID=747676 RepID=F4S012_MELLP|nr:uncharacterized protein MELLADRAFT_72856 [Melampsora larici-populina 98AG31]EGG01881.1 secreted protein [Melampsora larici-populina 98AG31]
MNGRRTIILLSLFGWATIVIGSSSRYEAVSHSLHARSIEEALKTFPKRDKITENLQYSRPLPPLAPFWSQTPPPVETVAIISKEYEAFIPELCASREAISKDIKLDDAVKSLSDVENKFSNVVNKFGPTCDGPDKPTRDELIKLQKIYIKIFSELEQILDLFEEKWPGEFVDKISSVSTGFSNSFQVLVSMGLNLKLDVNCILDFLHIKAFTTANIDILGIILLSRKVNSKLHQGQPLRF